MPPPGVPGFISAQREYGPVVPDLLILGAVQYSFIHHSHLEGVESV